VARFRTEHDRDHVLAKELGALFGGDFAPALALGRNLAHADRDLRGAEIANGDSGQDGFANHMALLKTCDSALSAPLREQNQGSKTGFSSTTENGNFRRLS
jgi:hypothetical protein